jgi:mRNA interferase RelE/StbE
MSYRVRYDKHAEKQLDRMDAGQRRLILAYIDSKIDGIEDPRSLGKGLSGNRAGQWRYRVGNYRLLCEIRDSELVIFVFKVGHRKDVYKGN